MLDQNILTYDETVKLLDNRSVRYCSMNTFSRVDPQVTTSFIDNFTAAKHLKLLDEQMEMMKKVNEKNDPIKAI